MTVSKELGMFGGQNKLNSENGWFMYVGIMKTPRGASTDATDSKNYKHSKFCYWN
jgi:hypothetical protein